MAASWSWGVSLAVGISIIITRGVVPFSIWALANIVAIPVFVYVWLKSPEFRKVLSSKPVLAAMLAIQVFAIWMNMRILKGSLVGGDLGTAALVSEHIAIGIVVVVSIILALVVYWGGLGISIATDRYQYALQLIGTLAIVVVALYYTGVASVDWGVSQGNLWWAVVGAAGLLSAPPLDMQQHQRVELGDGIGAGMWCAAFFGVYIVAVGLAGISLGGSATSSLLVAVVVFSIATSTLDSAYAALQELTGDIRYALGLSIACIVAWYPLSGVGIVDFWTMYATARIPIVLVLIVVSAHLSVSANWSYRDVLR